MAKNKKDYWTERQKNLNEQQDKDEKALNKRLEKYYDKESRKLEKEIARYYEEYGVDNVIEYRRLLEQLPEEDVRLLYEKMDDFAAKYPEYAHLMPVRESIYKLNRLEGLKTSVDMQMLENGAYLNKEVEKHLNKTSLRNMMDASKLLGNSFNFEDENVIRTFVGKAWTGGTNFSEKIWGNTKKLAEYINKDLAQGFARGTNYEKMVKQIRERYTNVSRKDAMRLVYTEGTYVMNESRARVFENDFEEYEIIPIEDKHTCDVCRGLQGKHFPYKDREPGENYPPLHPWCRCIAAPYTPEWDEENNNLDYTKNNDIIKQNSYGFNKGSSFSSKADPMADVFGPGVKSHPKEIALFKEECKKLGVNVIEREEESLSYQPNPIVGKPGQITVSSNASYAAWCHEMQHMRDDMESGWDGAIKVWDKDEHYKREKKAYEIEIEMAEDVDRYDIAELLKKNLEEERRNIYGNH